MELKEFKKIIDTEINNFLSTKIASLPQTDKNISENSSQLSKILSEGKRIRPYLSFLSYTANGGSNDKNAIKLFTFLEIFHAFCLVHDDIMDQAEKRHETETIHKFSENLLSKNEFVNPSRYGESVAILMGDLLFAWSYEILNSNENFDPDSINRIRNIFSEMINEVFLGQLIDINLPTLSKVSDDQIYLKIKLKTAGYSFTKPLLIGAALANINANTKFYEELGNCLGIAFQIQDDLLDLKYDEKVISKSAFNDIYQHQHTLFTNFVFKNGTPEQIKILKNSFGKKLDLNKQKELREIFIDSGAFEYGEKIISDNLTQAKKVIDESEFSTDYKILFTDLISIINGRKK